jgi:hypothetical protein
MPLVFAWALGGNMGADVGNADAGNDGTSDAVPRRRTRGLVVRAHGEETLVLDRRTGTVHCLPAEVTRVWGACTGQRTLAEVASAAGVDETAAASAVGQLMSVDLLAGCAGLDRRKLLRRGALVGAGVAVIHSVVAPAPSAQASPLNMSLVQTCAGSTNRTLVLTISQNAGPSGYNFIVTSPAGVSGQGNISAGTKVSGPAAFNIPDATTSITIALRDNGDGTLLTKTFTCAACPSGGGGTTTCTLPCQVRRRPPAAACPGHRPRRLCAPSPDSRSPTPVASGSYSQFAPKRALVRNFSDRAAKPAVPPPYGFGQVNSAVPAA